MDDKAIDLVQNSFKKVIPIADVAADIFYARLFEIAPEVKPLFTKDIKVQGQMLMAALGMAVNGLREPEKLKPVIVSLGERHKAYGVKDEYYALVGQALLFTLAKGLGDDFTPAVGDAWTQAYTLLAKLMQEA